MLGPAEMMAVLRDSGSGICMCDGAFRSNGAQASSGGGGGTAGGVERTFRCCPRLLL